MFRKYRCHPVLTIGTCFIFSGVVPDSSQGYAGSKLILLLCPSSESKHTNGWRCSSAIRSCTFVHNDVFVYFLDRISVVRYTTGSTYITNSHRYYSGCALCNRYVLLVAVAGYVNTQYTIHSRALCNIHCTEVT